jgi:formylmethanofuran dehydrogenase subunit E
MSDLIKREDAIKAVEECLKLLARPRYTVKTAIEAIPSVDIPHNDDWEKYSDKLWKNAYERGKADRPQGEWIEKEIFGEYNDDVHHYVSEWQSARCSVCGKYHTTPYAYYFDEYNFCPSCGARMKGADDES